MTIGRFLMISAAMVAPPASSTRSNQPHPAIKPRYELLSIASLPISDKQYVESFSIETWGVYPVAICHIPRGWLIGSDNDGTPGGKLHAQAGHGVSAVSNRNKNWDQFDAMFLVQVTDETGNGTPPVPPTFTLKATIMDYGQDDDGREQRFDTGLIRRTPADRCPEPSR